MVTLQTLLRDLFHRGFPAAPVLLVVAVRLLLFDLDLSASQLLYLHPRHLHLILHFVQLPVYRLLSRSILLFN